jgi:ATP phosphoribosyltransferase
VRVATKYPNLTRRHFEARGVQAECVKLNGAMEIAPALGPAGRIVDLVSSGQTLKENGLVETSVIMEISARLIVNRAALKTDPSASVRSSRPFARPCNEALDASLKQRSNATSNASSTTGAQAAPK